MTLQILNYTQFERIYIFWKINYWIADGSRKGLILFFVLGIGSLAFPRFWCGVRNSYEVVRNSARFSEKKLKIGKMDQRRVF